MTTLSSLEHDLIVSYLAEEHVILNIIFSAESEAEQIRLETGKNGVAVSKSGVITINPPMPELSVHIGKTVAIVFYFRKLGLTFSAIVEKIAGGTTLKIPRDISRLAEAETKEKPITANLYFSLSGKKDISFPCEIIESFPLFKAEVWQSIKGRAVVNTAQMLKQCYGMAIVQLPTDIYVALEKTGRLLCKNGEVIPEKNMFDFDLCVIEKDLTGKGEKEILAGIKCLPYSLYMPLDREHCLCAACETETIERFLLNGFRFASGAQTVFTVERHIETEGKAFDTGENFFFAFFI